ncbi:MAG: hypothetical protein PHG74_09190 [Kiritimatiellae bacterium]|nr:hypothetical protein [Kiritimatiellia bacterium]MDD3584176.1 hypothetical protein [Kiritimatiellia bacterium]
MNDRRIMLFLIGLAAGFCVAMFFVRSAGNIAYVASNYDGSLWCEYQGVKYHLDKVLDE